jgi:uncharacterized protein
VAANFEPEALHRLADSLSEDVLNTPAEQLLAEVAEDDRHPGALLREFDAILSRGERRAARLRLRDRLRRIGRAFPLSLAALASAPIVAVAIAFIAGAYYFDGPFRSKESVRPITFAASNESLRLDPSMAPGAKLAARAAAAAPAPAPQAAQAQRAASWLGEAAVEGQRSAQASLGIMLVEGQGIPRDVARGLSWLILAKDAAGPSEDWIKEAYASAYAHASESDRKAAQSYADAWLEHHPIASTR